jgi:TonB family protein
MHRVTPFLLAFGISVAAGAQAPAPESLPIPQSTYLKWDNLRLIVSPDSGELFIWAHLGELERMGSRRVFMATVDANAAASWTKDVRSFLEQKLGKKDSGAVRISPVLAGERGQRIYVGRRREHGNWSSERIIAMERRGDREPMLFAPNERDLRRILDTLDAVAARAPQPKRLGPPVYAFERLGPVDESATMLTAVPPDYPPGEVVARREGVVLLQFIVGVDGKAELPTVRVLHSTSEPFLRSALDALAKVQFNPASRRGAKVRQSYILPFAWNYR